MPFLCDLLKLSPREIGEMDLEEVAAFTAYHEGKALAEWANQPPPEKPRGKRQPDHQPGAH